MTWMPWLIIGLVLCMILGPILLLKPSPGQQRLARLRGRAPDLGLKIHMVRLGGEELAAYQLPWPAEGKRYARPDWCLERKNYAHDIHLCQYWYWVDSRETKPDVIQVLEQRLPLLPASIKGVEAGRQGVSCYWDERGGVSTQDAMTAWLRETQGMLWPLVAKTIDRDVTDVLPGQEDDDW